MAEERDLGVARAPEATDDEETTKQELQRRMDEAREHITQTVTEIKDTVTNQYQNVRESISGALDWREQVRRNPTAVSVGALSIGFLVGYGVAGALASSSSRRQELTYDYEDEDSDYDVPSTYSAGASPIVSPTGAYDSSASDPVSTIKPSYSSYSNLQSSAPAKPSLIDRFKDTQAFNRLEDEVAALGDRFVSELSNVAQNTVLPALIGKIKEVVGVDLSGQSNQQRSSDSAANQSASAAQVGSYTTPGAPQTSVYGATNQPSTEGQSSSNYGTSENANYSSTSTT